MCVTSQITALAGQKLEQAPSRSRAWLPGPTTSAVGAASRACFHSKQSQNSNPGGLREDTDVGTTRPSSCPSLEPFVLTLEVIVSPCGDGHVGGGRAGTHTGARELECAPSPPAPSITVHSPDFSLSLCAPLPSDRWTETPAASRAGCDVEGICMYVLSHAGNFLMLCLATLASVLSC